MEQEAKAPALDYGVPTDSQREQLATILTHAFNVTLDYEAAWMAATGHDSLRVVRAGDEVWGGLGLIPMGQIFGGRALPMLGVAAVGVRIDRLRRGVATTMMRHVLAEARERGFALSTLFASSWALYRKVGYGGAGTRHVASFSPAEIGPAAVHEPGVELRRATADDRPAVEALYRRHALGYPGHLDRGPYIWARIWDTRFGVPAHGVVLHDGEGLAGYAYYRKHYEPGALRHRMEITDLCARTPAAWRRLWTFLGDHATMVGRIELPTAPHDPMFLHHPDPRMRMSLVDNWFVRVTDIEGFLQGRAYGPALGGTVDLHLDDDVLPEQAGPWRLTVDGGKGRVARGGDGTVRLSPRGLASWTTGFTSLSTLAELGLASGPAEALHRAEALMAGPQPFMREMF